jgi:hypothetical protein
MCKVDEHAEGVEALLSLLRSCDVSHHNRLLTVADNHERNPMRNKSPVWTVPRANLIRMPVSNTAMSTNATSGQFTTWSARSHHTSLTKLSTKA